MANKLDQLVKGQPPPSLSPTQVAQSARALAPPQSIASAHLPNASATPTSTATSTNLDPRDILPSSPPQIYLNLLILESSLRLQYLALRARLRLHLLLLGVLSAWIFVFTYLLFFRPREDGNGVGGSVYWVVESTEKLGWCGGVVTLGLFYGTGMYERGVRWPRKFVSTTNRGLRGFNMKIVVVKGGLTSELAGWLSVLDPLGWFKDQRINFQILPKDIESGAAKQDWNHHAARHGLVEEDIAPSGDVLKVLLLPKPFSPDFREGWETYRMEYWEKENGRRAELRKVVTARHREVARRQGGWMGWMGWRELETFNVFSSKTRRQLDLDRLALREKPSYEERLKEKARREASHSRSSSRNSTPGIDEGRPDSSDGPRSSQRLRRGSTTRRPLKRPGSLHTSRLSASETLLYDERSMPESRASTISMDMDSNSSGADEAGVKKEECGDGGDGTMPIKLDSAD